MGGVKMKLYIQRDQNFDTPQCTFCDHDFKLIIKKHD